MNLARLEATLLLLHTQAAAQRRRLFRQRWRPGRICVAHANSVLWRLHARIALLERYLASAKAQRQSDERAWICRPWLRCSEWATRGRQR
ncbi:hypothetical protein CBM2587_P10017 [Cupriavidus taiwanensis]|uniref:Uncharacterized protein n=1 Tax=Cupriavidus taiwanensis TaxID=164546 RepID=A0A375CJI8_9BURK|nr:hypothetical protein CBM2587_P10017 [Cupriavidus taiwanensis]